MDEVKVEVLKPEILQTPPAGRLHMFRSMKRVPQFRCYEDLLPSADTGLHHALDPLSHLQFSVLSGEQSKPKVLFDLFLVAIVGGRVNVAVASPDD